MARYIDEGEKKPEMSEQEKEELEMETGEKDEDIETEQGREARLEHDEIKPREEGFMQGEADTKKFGDCANCGKVLSEEDEEVIELEIDNEKVRFCSNKCAEEYKAKQT